MLKAVLTGYFLGIAILIVAIVLNVIAMKLGIPTWHDFIGSIQGMGIMNATRSTPVPSLLFLTVVYPICLGLTAMLTARAIY
jgi:phosphate/sulfate permease